MADTHDRRTGAAASTDRLAGWIGVGAVACLPFALGGGPTWAWGTAAGCIGLALVLHGLAGMAGHPTARPAPAVPAACAVLGALALLTILQAVPGLPGAHPVWREVSRALDPAPAGTWSRTPVEAGPAVVRIATAGATLWLGAHAPVAVRRAAPIAIAGAAALCSAYGLLVLAAGSEQVLWLDKPAYRDVATGTFINRNAFGAFMGVALMALIAAARGRRAGRRGDLGWLAAPGLLVVAGLAASESRGAIVATVLAVTVLLAIVAARDGRGRAWGVAAGAAFGLGGLAVFALGDRLSGVHAALSQRAGIYDVALDAIAARPWLGHGAGAFDAVMRAARPPGVDEVVTQAHSLYLGAAVAWGLPAALALVAAAAGLTAVHARAAWRGDAVGMAALGTGLLLAVHGLIDFAPRLPGVALPALWLMGAGCRRSAPP
jgi:O-antigen ligase